MTATKWIAALLPTLFPAPSIVHASDIDTQFLFGFTQGADVGDVGEKEIESETIGRFGKSDGSYAALTSQLRAEFTPVENFRFEVGALLDYHAIASVSGLGDRNGFQFGGLALEARYRLLDRRTAPVGLAVGAEPHWTRIDETSGQPIAGYGGEFLLSVDRELVANRIFGAVNLLYGPEWTYQNSLDLWQRQSTLAVSAAVTTQVEDGIFIGAEAHYLRAYDGFVLDVFDGDAVFVGPTAYARLSRNFSISAAWSLQVAGHAVDASGPLDLRDFERHQARLRF